MVVVFPNDADLATKFERKKAVGPKLMYRSLSMIVLEISIIIWMWVKIEDLGDHRCECLV